MTLLLVTGLVATIATTAFDRVTISEVQNGTPNSPFYVGYDWVRDGFIASGLIWQFYANQTGPPSHDYRLLYRTSADGVTWSTATNVTPAGTTNFAGAQGYSVWSNGTDVEYALINGSQDLLYRRGTVSGDGMIAWLANAQVVPGKIAGFSPGEWPMIADDSNGYPYIVYQGSNNTGGMDLVLTHSSTDNGTWATAAGYSLVVRGAEYQKAIGYSKFWAGELVPLDRGDMTLLYGYDGSPVTATTWNGQAWSAPVNSTQVGWLGFAFPVSAVQNGPSSVAVIGSNVADIWYEHYDASTDSWNGEENITLAGSASIPLAMRDSQSNATVAIWPSPNAEEVMASTNFPDGAWTVPKPLLDEYEGPNGTLINNNAESAVYGAGTLGGTPEIGIAYTIGVGGAPEVLKELTVTLSDLYYYLGVSPSNTTAVSATSTSTMTSSSTTTSVCTLGSYCVGSTTSTATATSTTLTSSTTLSTTPASTSLSSTSSSEGIPEFPAQLGLALLSAAATVTSYVLVRRVTGTHF
jgi:hypothetical protein